MGPQVFSTFLLFLGYLIPVQSILCYQCNSTDTLNPYQCTEFLGSDIDIQPQPCSEVFGAAYCIKHTGKFGVKSILCYQCYAPNNTDCSDMLIHDRDSSTVEPKPCDHIFEARYCIKATGINDGSFGTRRYCSSKDLGNYCDTIKEKWDQRKYRSCKYTCSTDGCNSSRMTTGSINLAVVLSTIIWLQL